MQMISVQNEIDNLVVCYENEYGMSYEQEVLCEIALEKGYFKTPENVEPILDIFLNEKVDEFCYDKDGCLIEGEIIEHPELVEKMIEKNLKL